MRLSNGFIIAYNINGSQQTINVPRMTPSVRMAFWFGKWTWRKNETRRVANIDNRPLNGALIRLPRHRDGDRKLIERVRVVSFVERFETRCPPTTLPLSPCCCWSLGHIAEPSSAAFDTLSNNCGVEQLFPLICPIFVDELLWFRNWDIWTLERLSIAVWAVR